MAGKVLRAKSIQVETAAALMTDLTTFRPPVVNVLVNVVCTAYFKFELLEFWYCNLRVLLSIFHPKLIAHILNISVNQHEIL